ncbi:pyocin knob domain-containing protein [Klebsiella quasipneumoniae]|uniref:pyocin knob domain-containing protein n=1 Tax=Klebsiella quasipneumoniae TaxID=1463165 RepID=UPI002FDFB558
MYHLDNTSGVPEMPTPKETQSISPRWFGESQEQGGISWPGADWFNIIQAELLAVLELLEEEPDKTNNNQIAFIIKRLSELFPEKISSTDGYKEIGTPFGSLDEVIDFPYTITGRVNIKNRRWGAPVEGAEDDTPEAAAANAAAINRMLAAGGRYVELDDRARRVNDTLLYRSEISIYGAGKTTTSLVWTGDDLPVIARPGYANKDTAGFSGINIHNLKIDDRAKERVHYYTVDLFNGNSSGLTNCWINCPGVDDSDGKMVITADRYGVGLGLARKSILPGTRGFVAHLRNSRITNGTLMLNGTDYYVSQCELWGSYRKRAVEISGGGTICGGTQIVPGEEAGLFLFNDNNFDIDTLKLIGVYFDGSTNHDLFTGWGIKSAEGIGLTSAEIYACDFWNMNLGGVNLSKFHSSSLQANFRDCDSDDTGEDDIVIGSIFGSYVYNRHFRGPAPKKSGAERVNLGRPYTLTGLPDFALSSVGGQISHTAQYLDAALINRELFDNLGGSRRTNLQYLTTPSAIAFQGKFLNVAGRAKFSNGSRFIDLTPDATVLPAGTNLDNLVASGPFYTADIATNTSIPSLTGKCMVFVTYITSSFIYQAAIQISTGKQSTRIMNNGVWQAWSPV